MYILFIVLIVIASVLIILAVLAQSPKSGMAANFGASNQVMGVRQTADFLEKFTWTMSIVIVVLSLLASMSMSSHRRAMQPKSDKLIENVVGTGDAQMPNQVALPQNETATEGEATQEATEVPAEQPAEQPAE